MEPIYIFDIDGVIQQPEKKIPNPTILAFIAKQLEHENPVAIATGRALSYVEKHIVSQIALQLSDPHMLDNLFLSCEKGAVTGIYMKGELLEHDNTHYTIPQELEKVIHDHIKAYSGIFFDHEKKTMISLEMEGQESAFSLPQQHETLQRLEEWITKEVITSYPDIVIDKSQIAIDLQKKSLSKRISAENFLAFLHKRQKEITSFAIFGDNESDGEIGNALTKNSYQVTFYYVGEKKLEKTFPFSVISSSTGKLYDQAVVELLPKQENDLL